MKLPDILRKFSKQSSQQTSIPTSDVITDAKPPGLPDKILRQINTWVRANKKLAALLAVVAVLGLSGGVYAALSSFGNNKNAPDISTATTTPNVTESADGQTPAASQAPTSTNKSASGGSTTSPSNTVIGTTGPIGFVGCSNIRDSVQGYADNGGDNFWVPNDRTYAGGTVTKWGDLSSEYWAEFDQFLAQYPTTKTIWWGLCSYDSDRESDASNNTAAPVVLEQIRKKIPGVTIYVSALNDFVAPHTCRITGSDGPSRMRTLASNLVSNYGLKAGPELPALLSVYQTPSAGATTANNQTKDDGCHPNDAGDILLGKSLVDFFGS